MLGGIPTTAGGLVFTGASGEVVALDAETLDELWRFETGSGINAPPITYSVDGKQYVALLVGLGAWPKWFVDSTEGLEKVESLLDALRVRALNCCDALGGPECAGPPFARSAHCFAFPWHPHPRTPRSPRRWLACPGDFRPRSRRPPRSPRRAGKSPPWAKSAPRSALVIPP